jgi:hypothetical protein
MYSNAEPLELQYEDNGTKQMKENKHKNKKEYSRCTAPPAQLRMK